MRAIALLLVPGGLLPALACSASGALAAWATLALVALALIVLEGVGFWIGPMEPHVSKHGVSTQTAPAASAPTQAV